ncbi:hypothetical protein [Mitsuokella jalaludinii]
METIMAFMAGAMVGMAVASLAAVSGRCAYEEEVRNYYERYYRQEKKHG